jgi:hypothetical protein
LKITTTPLIWNKILNEESVQLYRS